MDIFLTVLSINFHTTKYKNSINNQADLAK